MPDEKRSEVVGALRELLGMPYGWLPVLLKGLRIVTGRDWPYFQWKVFLDLSVAVSLLDLPFWLLLHHPVLSWLIPAHLGVVMLNAILWRIRPLRFTEWTGKPSDALHMLQRLGGTFMLDALALHQQARAIKSDKTATDVSGNKHP
jgi:hypothetical protein